MSSITKDVQSSPLFSLEVSKMSSTVGSKSTELTVVDYLRSIENSLVLIRPKAVKGGALALLRVGDAVVANYFGGGQYVCGIVINIRGEEDMSSILDIMYTGGTVERNVPRRFVHRVPQHNKRGLLSRFRLGDIVDVKEYKSTVAVAKSSAGQRPSSAPATRPHAVVGKYLGRIIRIHDRLFDVARVDNNGNDLNILDVDVSEDRLEARRLAEGELSMADTAKEKARPATAPALPSLKELKAGDFLFVKLKEKVQKTFYIAKLIRPNKNSFDIHVVVDVETTNSDGDKEVMWKLIKRPLPPSDKVFLQAELACIAGLDIKDNFIVHLGPEYAR
jgi:hypothetical protein